MKKKNSIFSHLGLKILALVISFALWFVVTNISDNVIRKTITDIEVDMKNGDSILKEGKAYDITGGETVTIIVKGPRSVVENMEAGDFYAYADLSKLSVTNSTTIEVSTNTNITSKKAKQISISTVNKYVTLSIEQEVEKDIPVRIITTGAVASGHALGSAIPTPNIINISGPASVLANIVEARAVVNVNGASEDITDNVRLGCIDGYGSAVVKDNIKMPVNNVEVTIPVYKTKKVPINVRTIGTPNEGYGVRRINYNPTEVVISGETEKLDAVESIEITDIMVSEVSENIEKNIRLEDYMPSDIFLADDNTGEVAISVEIEEVEERELILNKAVITIDNENTNYKYQFNAISPQKVKISGFEEDIKTIAISELNPKINVEGLGVGEHEVEITFEEGDTYKIKGTYSVKLEVSDKNDESD